MVRLLFVTRTRDSFAELASALEGKGEVELYWAGSGGEALDRVAKTLVDLVVTDEFLRDMTGLELAEKMLSINPMINCAAVSTLSSKQFHEASEGLGVLAQLSAEPDKEEAEELFQRLVDLKRCVAEV